MSEHITTLYNGVQNCPVCGEKMYSAQYYIMHRKKSNPNTISNFKNQNKLHIKTSRIKYTDISLSYGNICLNCGINKEKKTRIIGLSIAAISLIFSIISFIFWFFLSSKKINSILFSILIMIGFILYIIGLAIYFSKRGFYMTKNIKDSDREDHISGLFVEYAENEYPPPEGTMYLSTWAGRKLLESNKL